MVPYPAPPLAAEFSLPRLAVADHAAAGADNTDSQSAEDGFQVGGAAVDAAARLADAPDAADHPLPVGAVLQVYAELVGRLVFHFFPIPNVALALEDFGQ